MSAQESNGTKIARNTLFLYFRMMFTMIVSLYTSRVILQTLGVTDYGIYQTVGGIIGIVEDSYCSVIWGFIIVVSVCVTSVLVSSWFIGLDASIRTKLVAVMRNRLLSKN